MGSTEIAISLEAGARRGVDIVLRGESAETITVTADAALVNEYQIGATSTLTHEVAKNVTFATRLYSSSVLPLPGVVRINEAVPALNGGDSTEVATFVDGVDTSQSRRRRRAAPLHPHQLDRRDAARSRRLRRRVRPRHRWRPLLDHPLRNQPVPWRGPLHRSEHGLESGVSRARRSAPRPPDRQLRGDSRRADRAGKGLVLRLLREHFRQPARPPGDRRGHRREPGVRAGHPQAQPPALEPPSDRAHRHRHADRRRDRRTAVPADIYALSRLPLDGELYTATWSFAVGSSTFLEAKGSTRDDHVGRERYASHDLATGVSPDDPDGNNFRYVDQTTAFRWNAPAMMLGFNDFPRDQANASATFFWEATS